MRKYFIVRSAPSLIVEKFFSSLLWKKQSKFQKRLRSPQVSETEDGPKGFHNPQPIEALDNNRQKAIGTLRIFLDFFFEIVTPIDLILKTYQTSQQLTQI